MLWNINPARPPEDSGAYINLLKKCLVGYLYPESSNLRIYPRVGMNVFRRLVLRELARRGYLLFKGQPFDAAARRRGTDWPNIGYSMIGLNRLDNLQQCVETILNENVPGDLIETGVWRGGACILMRAVLKVRGVRDRTVWLADSFQGLPTPSSEIDAGYDLSTNVYLAVSVDEVKAAFERFELLDEHVRFLKGWFKDTLCHAPIDRLAVLRMDGDLYESTRDALHALYDKVSLGGFVIVDDYGDWPPCRRAIEEFRAERNIVDPIQDIDGRGVFWRKS